MPIPTPSPNETREDFGSRCIPVLVGEGKDASEASAICFAEFDRQTEGTHEDEEEKKRKKEALPTTLNCDPIDVTAEEVGAAGSALIHAWTHRLWASGLRGTELLEAHEDAIRTGAAAGLEHENCDDLDEAATAARG